MEQTAQQTTTSPVSSMPTEIVELPSKGLVYPKDNPLSAGKIEMRYMTAKHEDILTNQNYIKNGTVMDNLLKALIVTPINYDDLILGDKNAILVAARILGYGKNYKFNYYNPVMGETEKVTVDLTQLKEKSLDPSLLKEPHTNEFEYEFPETDNVITFKLLTNADDKVIDQEIKSLEKLYKGQSFDITVTLKHQITSVNGSKEPKAIRDFVDNHLMARDSRAFRSHVKKIAPDIIMEFDYSGEGYAEEGVSIPVTVEFFWPES